MDKIKKLLDKRRQRDRIDCVSEHFSDVTSSASLPMFYVSSASAASVQLIFDVWMGSLYSAENQSDSKIGRTSITESVTRPPLAVRSPIRLVLIVASSAPLPRPGTHPVELPHYPKYENVRITADVHILGGNSNVVDCLSDEAVDGYLQLMQELESSFEKSLGAHPSSTMDEPNQQPQQTTLCSVPIYFLKIPMQDDGSQRLALVMRGISLLLNGCCRNPSLNHTTDNVHVLPDLMSKNSVALIRVLTMPNPRSVIRALPPHQVGVLVHCLQGISRSVSVIIWYVVQQCIEIRGQSPTVEDVLKWIRAARPCACPNLCFAAELGSMEKRLRAGSK
jgi:hypothetical protein